MRLVFEKYNDIRLHSFLSDKNFDFKNLLPPLHLLDEKEKKELNSALSEIGFDIKTLKAA